MSRMKALLMLMHTDQLLLSGGSQLNHAAGSNERINQTDPGLKKRQQQGYL